MSILNFLSDFFFPKTLPENGGFTLYGKTHIIWIAVILLSIVILSIVYRKSDKKAKKAILISAGLALAVSEILRIVFHAAMGNLNYDLMPLHLCGIAMLVCIFYPFKNIEFLGDFMYSTGLPGAVSALLFPNWTNYSAGTYFNFQSFFAHFIIVLIPILIIAGGDFKPNYKNLPKCGLFLLIIAAGNYFLNMKIMTNFMFLRYPSPGSPLVIFEEWLGNPGYIFGILITLLVVWLVLYLPFAVMQWVSGAKKKALPAE
ncbi:MAG: TIGR02206 family membrane protein [Oscillospiraceae bacterium]|jgi:hypothetical integral membrane protein (TIGR02206 family)|nr:TIGR02206 family membrane protein [Oscillospiraceae bacterium]